MHCCGHLAIGWGPWQLVTDEELDEGCDAGNEEDEDEDEVTDDNQVADDENEVFDMATDTTDSSKEKKLFVICHLCM